MQISRIGRAYVSAEHIKRCVWVVLVAFLATIELLTSSCDGLLTSRRLLRGDGPLALHPLDRGADRGVGGEQGVEVVA